MTKTCTICQYNSDCTIQKVYGVTLCNRFVLSEEMRRAKEKHNLTDSQLERCVNRIQDKVRKFMRRLK